MGYNPYAKEEKEWLIENSGRHKTFKGLVRAFNDRFKKDRKYSSVVELCNKRLHIKMGRHTTFKSGKSIRDLPIGTIKVCGNGTTYIKVKAVLNSAGISGYQEPYWLPVQKKVWIEHYGEVAKGKFVIFLNKNCGDLEIGNLYCVDRKIHSLMCANNWYTENREHTLTAIKLCELYFSIK